MQNQDPFFSSGANQVSLIQAQKNFVDLGAAEVRSLAHVRGPNIDEVPPAPTLSLDSELWEMKEIAVKIALLGTVRSIKTGAIALLEGCTAVSALSWPVKVDAPLEESLRIFKGVASEIDDMPTGRVRELWSAAALADKDAQMAEYEKRVRPAVLDGCDRWEAAVLAGLKTGGTIGI